MFDRNKTEAELVQFVQLRGQRHASVTSETDLLESGLLDSLLLMDLIFHIEELYGIRFESDHIDPSNFNRVSDIAALVADRMSAAGRRLD